jgi:hypothetical protein
VGVFSLQSIDALTNVVTGGGGFDTAPSIGLYRSGPTLVSFFRVFGLNLEVFSRVPSVRQLLEEVNERPDGRNILGQIVERVTDPRDFLDEPEKLANVVEHLNRRFVLDGLEVRRAGRVYRLVGMAVETPAVIALRERIEALDLDSVQRDFDRAMEEGDPEDAVTGACSTVESVCKCLLDLMGEPYPAKQDIAGLTKEVSRHLNLSPDRPDITPDIKQILGGLANVCGGIGSLRTHGGDAHGRGKGTAKVDARIARLAVHAASTVSLFLIETWQLKAERKQSSPAE